MKKRLSPQSEAQFNQALKLKDQERYEEAVELLRPISERHPDIAATFGIMGGCYNMMGRYEEGAANYGKAVEINPRSELATRGLFNALWDLGREKEAIAKLRRFKALTGSTAFDDILESYRRERESDSN